MKKTEKQRPLPWLFRKPYLFAMIMGGLDLLLLIAAAVLNSVRGNFEVSYTYEEPVITKHNPLDVFGYGAAAILVLAAVLFAFLLVGILLSRARGRKGAAIKVVGAFLLLVISVAVVFFSWNIVIPQTVGKTTAYCYTDETHELIFTEETYLGGEDLLSIYLNNNDGTATFIAATELHERSDNADRYELIWTTVGLLTIRFDDGMNKRTMRVEVPVI